MIRCPAISTGRRTQTYYRNVAIGNATVTYSYDGLGRETAIASSLNSFTSILYGYDTLGRRDAMTQDGRTLAYLYDIAGRRIRVTWPDGFYVTYDYSSAGQVAAIRENGGTALVGYAYDGLGRAARPPRAQAPVDKAGSGSGGRNSGPKASHVRYSI